MTGATQRVFSRSLILLAPLNSRGCYDVDVELPVGVVDEWDPGLLEGVVGGEYSGTLCRAFSSACRSTIVSLSFCSFVFCDFVKFLFTVLFSFFVSSLSFITLYLAPPSFELS
jgi:hypothetical protein